MAYPFVFRLTPTRYLRRFCVPNPLHPQISRSWGCNGLYCIFRLDVVNHAMQAVRPVSAYIRSVSRLLPSRLRMDCDQLCDILIMDCSAESSRFAVTAVIGVITTALVLTTW